MEAGTVDLGCGNRANADLCCATDDGMEKLLALLVPYLLGVVQARERTNPGAPQRLVVEEHPSDDEWSCERAATRLVRARDVADAETSIVCEKPLTRRAGHADEDTR